MIIPHNWEVPEAIRLRMGQNTFGRQRAIVEEGHVMLVLHVPPGPDDDKRQGILFWRTPNGDWACNKGGGKPALKRHIEAYGAIEDKLSDEYEKTTTISGLFALVDQLTPLARAARNMHAAVQSAREATEGDTYLIEARDMAYEVERNLELLLEDVRNAIQYRVAKETEEQAILGRQAVVASHRLNTIAALFLPLTAVAGVFGMELTHGLDKTDKRVFWLVFGVGALLGFLVKGWVLATTRAPKPRDAK